MWVGAGQEKTPPKITFHGTRVSMQTKILQKPSMLNASVNLAVPDPTGHSDDHGMTQLLPSCSRPTLVGTFLPLCRVSHCTESAAVSVKHLGKLKQASVLKSGPISKQQKGSIFSIWFAPLRHSLSHSQSYWEQSCILTGVVHIRVCKALPCQCCHCWERTLLL